ncbi:hypothetical protein ACWDO0_34495 [Nocardia rhamnosiphila]
MDSAYAKLGRAKEHLASLHSDVKGYRGRDPHYFERKETKHWFHSERRVIRIIARVREPAPTLAWSLMVGDILTSLRASLDHAVHGHASARNTLTGRQHHEMSFPILSNRLRWFGDPAASSRRDREGARTRLAPFLLPDVLDAIEQNQPFNTVDPNWSGINVLNSMVNLDKHQSLRFVSYSTEEITVTKASVTVIKVEPHPDTPMEDGAVVGTATIELPPPANKYRPRPGGKESLPFDVDLGFIEKIEIPTLNIRRSLLEVMDALVKDVETVLDELRAAGC